MNEVEGYYGNFVEDKHIEGKQFPRAEAPTQLLEPWALMRAAWGCGHLPTWCPSEKGADSPFKNVLFLKLEKYK